MVLAALIAFGLLVMAWLAAPAEERRQHAVPAAPTPMEALPEAA
jgi:hypothetical protein